VNAEKDRYLRLMAEFDNYKKRISRDYDRLVESANEKLILDLIDVRENFDRAIQSAQTNTDYQGLLDGLKLIYSKFESILEKNGLEVFAAPGDQFDPQIHDALMKSVHPEIPEDHISEVYEKGYKLKGRVIKHAKVIVSSGPQS
jgi:molecular chaperone GrpE